MDHICVIFVLYMRYHFFYIWYMYNICILCITHVCIWHKTVNEYYMFGNKMKYKYFIINKYRNTMLLSKFGFTTVQLAAEEVWLWQFVKHIFHILFFEQPLEKIRYDGVWPAWLAMDSHSPAESSRSDCFFWFIGVRNARQTGFQQVSRNCWQACGSRRWESSVQQIYCANNAEKRFNLVLWSTWASTRSVLPISQWNAHEQISAENWTKSADQAFDTACKQAREEGKMIAGFKLMYDQVKGPGRTVNGTNLPDGWFQEYLKARKVRIVHLVRKGVILHMASDYQL